MADHGRHRARRTSATRSQRARDLLVQGANDTNGAGGPPAIVTEVTQLIDSIKTDANTQYAGCTSSRARRRTTQPYQLGATTRMRATPRTHHREIGAGMQVAMNQTGSSVIGDAPSGLLTTLRTIVNDLRLRQHGRALDDRPEGDGHGQRHGR